MSQRSLARFVGNVATRIASGANWAEVAGYALRWLRWADGGLRPPGEALAKHDSREVRNRCVSTVTTGVGKWRNSLNESLINYFGGLSFVCVKTIHLEHSLSIGSSAPTEGYLKIDFPRKQPRQEILHSLIGRTNAPPFTRFLSRNVYEKSQSRHWLKW